MSTARLSTNAKLAILINGPNDDDDAESKRRIMEAAQGRLRRATLYGSGARAQVPKVKAPYKQEASPFTVMQGYDLPAASTALDSAVPPGAHMDQFRLVTNPTMLSLNDPDRVFLNSSTMKDGLIVVPGGQPPWYFGNNNKTKPPDSNFATMAASRYGFKGAQQIRQRHVEPYERPSNTRHEHTPHFLNGGEDFDEWVPPIVHAKFNTVNGLESPKLWPENTEYPSGYKQKRVPTSSRYRRETTTVIEDRPTTSHAMHAILNRTVEKTMLSDYARMEKDRTFLSLPMTAQQQFAANWADRLDRDANQTLRVTMKREVPGYEAHTLSDPTDVMRYSGTTALIVNSQSSEEVKFRSRLERSKETIPYDLRWKKVIALFRAIKVRLKRDESMDSVIREMAGAMRAEASRLGASTILRRSDFVNIVTGVAAFEGFDIKLFSAVYGVFDPLKKNIMRFVELIKSFALLDNFEFTTDEKLQNLWDLNMEYGQDMSPFDIALTCLCNVCASDQDSDDIKRLFKQMFKPACYRVSISEEKIPGMHSQGASGGDHAETPILKTDQVMSAMPAYNIINNFLNRDTFIKVLHQCPELWKKFDSCLDARLVSCFGSGRVKEVVKGQEGGVGGAAISQDFGWILKKKKKKIGSQKKPTIARRPSINKKDDVAGLLED